MERCSVFLYFLTLYMDNEVYGPRSCWQPSWNQEVVDTPQKAELEKNCISSDSIQLQHQTYLATSRHSTYVCQ